MVEKTVVYKSACMKGLKPVSEKKDTSVKQRNFCVSIILKNQNKLRIKKNTTLP